MAAGAGSGAAGAALSRIARISATVSPDGSASRSLFSSALKSAKARSASVRRPLAVSASIRARKAGSLVGSIARTSPAASSAAAASPEATTRRPRAIAVSFWRRLSASSQSVNSSEDRARPRANSPR